MTREFLLFDARCPQCTKVAKRLRELEIQDLEVRSMDDPGVVEQFAQHNRELPSKPALVHRGEQRLVVRTGIAMRMRLARLLGARRAAEIVGLLALEAQAHVARRTDAESRTSRRGLLGGAAAGAGALVFGTALPAAAQPTPQPGAPLDTEFRRRVLSLPPVQQAGELWGAPEGGAITTVAEHGQTVAIVPHRGEYGAFTAVATDGDPVAITIVLKAEGDGLRYYLPSGAPLAVQTVRDGQLTTEPLTVPAPGGPGPQPDGVPEFTGCFIACVGSQVDVDCVLSCIGCATGGLGAIVDCPVCAVCAGPTAVRCARLCEPLL